MNHHLREIGLGAVILVCGVLIGRFGDGRSKEIASLRAQIDAIGAKNRSRGEVGRPTMKAGPFDGMARPSATERHSSGEIPMGASAEEYEDHLRIQKARRSGEFFLRFDDPVERRSYQSVVKSLVDQDEAQRRAGSHSKVFLEAGVPAEKVDSLHGHLSKIMKASLEAEGSIKQLLSARVEYDRRVRELMSEDGYSRYKEFEGSRAAERELQGLSDFLSRSRLTIDEPTSGLLRELIVDSATISAKTWHGPYDGLPEVAVGHEHVTENLKNEIARRRDAIESLEAGLGSIGISDEVRGLVRSYYSEKLAALEENLQNLVKWKGMRPAEKKAMIREISRVPVP